MHVFLFSSFHILTVSLILLFKLVMLLIKFPLRKYFYFAFYIFFLWLMCIMTTRFVRFNPIGKNRKFKCFKFFLYISYTHTQYILRKSCGKFIIIDYKFLNAVCYELWWIFLAILSRIDGNKNRWCNARIYGWRNYFNWFLFIILNNLIIMQPFYLF